MPQPYKCSPSVRAELSRRNIIHKFGPPRRPVLQEAVHLRPAAGACSKVVLSELSSYLSAAGITQAPGIATLIYDGVVPVYDLPAHPAYKAFRQFFRTKLPVAVKQFATHFHIPLLRCSLGLPDPCIEVIEIMILRHFVAQPRGQQLFLPLRYIGIAGCQVYCGVLPYCRRADGTAGYFHICHAVLPLLRADHPHHFFLYLKAASTAARYSAAASPPAAFHDPQPAY